MKRGTVVLSPFPFTDLSGRKTRPALVVSRSDRSGSDVMLAFITTYIGSPYIGSPLSASDLLIETTHPDFVQTGLKRSSVVKLDKLITVERSILLGELGEFSTVLMQIADAKLRYALELS
jgi:mRNA interferase MazF